MSTITLTPENYFSQDASIVYMSYSQFKAFMACPAAVLAEIRGEYEPFGKDAFLEGHLFEAVLNGTAQDFYLLHPECISSKGTTKGQPKANFLKIIDSAEAFMRQPEMMAIVQRCEAQKIVTGTINGIPYKGCIDLYDPETGDCWDTKCMRNFDSQYSPDEGRRLEWWEYYGYHYQAAIYRELCRQNFGKVGRFGLMAATKEAVPDVTWLQFDNKILDAAYDIVYELSPMFQGIKTGLIDAESCGKCDYCKSVKRVAEPTIISQYETITNDTEVIDNAE